MDRLDANPRVVYATTGLTIDMVFSASYALLVATLLLRVIRGGAPLYLPPLASALADVLENTTFRGEDRVHHDLLAHPRHLTVWSASGGFS